MPRSKKIPCSLRLYVAEDVRDWLKTSATARSEPITTFARSLIVDAMERAKRGVVCRGTDPLIYEMSETMKTMAEKMGIEGPEKQSGLEVKK
jgi:hypothetical protein